MGSLSAVSVPKSFSTSVPRSSVVARVESGTLEGTLGSSLQAAKAVALGW